MGELDALERQRATESAAAARLVEHLRGENALLTAAASRLHAQWQRDATECESLRSEIKALDSQLTSARRESTEMVHVGAEVRAREGGCSKRACA